MEKAMQGQYQRYPSKRRIRLRRKRNAKEMTFQLFKKQRLRKIS